MSPRYFSGRVERNSWKEKPKTLYTQRRKSRQPFISSSIYTRERFRGSHRHGGIYIQVEYNITPITQTPVFKSQHSSFKCPPVTCSMVQKM